MIKELQDIAKKFAKPTEREVTQIDINAVTGDYKKDSAKFVQDVHAKMTKKKHTNVILIAVSY
jgi:hypothetical protein